jgi:hypothetical protein
MRGIRAVFLLMLMVGMHALLRLRLCKGRHTPQKVFVLRRHWPLDTDLWLRAVFKHPSQVRWHTLTALVRQPGGLGSSHSRCLCRPCWRPADWVVVLGRGVSAPSNLDCKPLPAAALAKEADRPRAGSTSSSTSGGCRVCGGPPAVAAACSAHPRCVAFVMDAGDPGCGHLKSGTDRQVPSQAHMLFCNTARGAKCTGESRRLHPNQCDELAV